jgi:hypothetical protein
VTRNEKRKKKISNHEGYGAINDNWIGEDQRIKIVFAEGRVRPKKIVVPRIDRGTTGGWKEILGGGWEVGKGVEAHGANPLGGIRHGKVLGLSGKAPAVPEGNIRT